MTQGSRNAHHNPGTHVHQAGFITAFSIHLTPLPTGSSGLCSRHFWRELMSSGTSSILPPLITVPNLLSTCFLYDLIDNIPSGYFQSKININIYAQRRRNHDCSTFTQYWIKTMVNPLICHNHRIPKKIPAWKKANPLWDQPASKLAATQGSTPIEEPPIDVLSGAPVCGIHRKHSLHQSGTDHNPSRVKRHGLRGVKVSD